MKFFKNQPKNITILNTHSVILEGGPFKGRLKDPSGMSTTKGILRFQLRMTDAKASYRITGGGIISPTLSSSREGQTGPTEGSPRNENHQGDSSLSAQNDRWWRIAD